jgi:hypothetical protein
MATYELVFLFDSEDPDVSTELEDEDFTEYLERVGKIVNDETMCHWVAYGGWNVRGKCELS